ncbi:hypothetical protein IAU60_003806 [Kwoniella sp. DSM 27419]
MSQKHTFLVLGATGGTGRHFVRLALHDGHRVRALVRSPDKLEPGTVSNPQFELVKGSITDPGACLDTDRLTSGVDYVICMVGDRTAQTTVKINTAFVKRLIPSMRRNGVTNLLYQAGGFSKPYQRELPWMIWILRHTIARSYAGQHQDNEAVMEYLETEARDINWIVHRAAIGSDGPSKGTLERCTGSRPGIGTFGDCADYSYRIIMDKTAVHTSDLSSYR